MRAAVGAGALGSSAPTGAVAALKRWAKLWVVTGVLSGLFGVGALGSIRALVSHHAVAAGFPAPRTEDLVLDHYLEILQHKPGAMPGSTALAQARASGRVYNHARARSRTHATNTPPGSGSPPEAMPPRRRLRA